MEGKIIVAVCGHPALYDTGSMFYRDRAKKEQAWVSFINMCHLLLFSYRLCFTMNQTLALVSTNVSTNVSMKSHLAQQTFLFARLPAAVYVCMFLRAECFVWLGANDAGCMRVYVCLSEDICRRRRKSLCDVCIREKKKEGERRSRQQQGQ